MATAPPTSTWACSVALIAFSIAGLFENNWGDTEVQRLVLFLLAVPFCLEADEAGAPAIGAGAA